MLILTRRAGEALVIDGGLRITLLSTDGRVARIGIDAPPAVRILRAEIVEQIEQETKRASGASREWIALAPVAGTR
jgi:carbon storage regulator